MARRYSKYTDYEILAAIASQPNFTAAADILGVNRKTVMACAKRHGVTHNGKRRLPDISEKVFSKKDKRDGNLRTYIRKYSLMEEVCAECGLSDEWNDKPLVLQLDHIDGDPTNDLKENLRWLCPNCHSQTETFCGRNKK